MYALKINCLFIIVTVLAVFLSGSAYAQHITISGTILDEDTEQPVVGAHVFIANTMIGAVTDGVGYFSLSGIPFGSHVVAVSMLGYAPAKKELRVTENENQTMIFRLTPRVYNTEGIEVVSERASRKEERRRESDFETFRKYFLGVSPYASQCTILNPEVLTFENNRREGRFIARANDALLIENLALGYEVRFLLEEFEVRETRRNHRIKYGGQTGFKELTPESERQERRWMRNREAAYRGSERHFLAALVSDKLWEEGYMLIREEENQNDYSGVPGVRPSNRAKRVDPDEILRQAGLSFEWVLDFSGYLKVINMKEIPEDQYLLFKDIVAGWQLNDDEQQQTSWLALTRGPVTITADGRLNEQYGITKLGYWFFERVAETLPIEYTPAGSALFTAETPTENPLEFDINRADALISRAVHDLRADTTEEVLERVSSAYLEILEEADEVHPEDIREIIHRHLSQTIYVLPDSILDDVLTKPYQYREKYVSIKPGTGARLARWWRTQDPFPATSTNERVIEHLLRVGTATDLFSDKQATSGFDDRGLVYIRYGAPRTRTVIQTDLQESRKILQQFAVPLPGPLIVPSNEFWSYNHIDERLQYVFLLTGGRYRISSPEDLIPDDLRTASKRSGKRQVTTGNAPINRVDEAYARALVEAYQTVYRDLALFHPAYEEQIQQLDFYEADLRATSGLDITQNQTDLAASGGGMSASSYIQGISSQFTSQAHLARVQRDEEAPRSNSVLLDRIIPLPVAMRASRFLTDEGATRVEINWSHIPGTLTMTNREFEQLELLAQQNHDQDQYLVQLAVVERAADFSRFSGSRLSYLASDLEKGAPAPVQSFDVELTELVKHVSLQWSQHLFDQNNTGEYEIREELKVGIQHVRGLNTLSTEGGVLEMSDPKPIYLGSDSLFFNLASEGELEMAAYPYSTITTQTPLGLYFEVYELLFGPDDLARFTVEYEVTYNARRRRDRETTAVTTSYTSESRTAREFIAIDLTGFENEGPLDIRMTITDEVSQQHVERLLRFTLVDTD